MRIIIKTVENANADATVLGTIDYNGICGIGFGRSTIADMVLTSLTEDLTCFFTVDFEGFAPGDDQPLRVASFVFDALAQYDKEEVFWRWARRFGADYEYGVVPIGDACTMRADSTLGWAIGAEEEIIARTACHYLAQEGDALRVVDGAEYMSAYDEEYQAHLDDEAAELNCGY